MRLHLIDGTYELFRHHFSPRESVVGADGRSLKAMVGLVESLLALLRDPAEAVTHLAVAFDNPIRSFRNELYAGYKTEDGVPEELLAQFDEAEAAVAALGVVVWSMDEFEADDALATAAARFSDRVEQVRIFTPDKDLSQCVRGRRVVQIDRRNRREFDEDGVRARWGILPSSMPDLLALMGDASDGYPGLSGFGEKTSAALLAHYHHLEAIPDDAGAWAVKVRGAERLAKTLAEGRDQAALFKRLATLRADVPLPQTLDELGFRGVPRARFVEFCARHHLPGLAARPTRWKDES